MASGQAFLNADAFRDAMYLMSISGRFRYYYNRNCFKHITVICTVNDCLWKITCCAVGASHLVKVHMFVNEHIHTVDDLVSSQTLVRCNQASMVIDDVIRCTPKYMPRQICKDFVLEHGMCLTYVQAWHIKEKAKERIYSQLKNFYKLLSWLCERIKKKCNLGSVVELTHSSDGHFQQLFIAHEVSIIGFLSGCRTVIAIDSSHMSEPYGGAQCQ